MATATTTAHLLSPQRVDQLVIEHYDPPSYPRYPSELIAAHEALRGESAEIIAASSSRLVAADLNAIEHGDDARVRAHFALLDDRDARQRVLETEILAILDARREVLTQLWRALPQVAAETHRSENERYLGAQQWLLQVHEAATAARVRSDFRGNIRRVAEALAKHARSDGIFLAGAADVQDTEAIPHSTWTRAYSWLVQHDLAVTLHERRLLTQLERALAIGTQDRSHVRRWRSVIQLQHVAAKVCRPANWVSPRRRRVTAPNSLNHREKTTDLRPVDSASRSKAAPSSRPAPKKTSKRGWRTFHPRTQTLYKLLQLLAQRLSTTAPGSRRWADLLGRQNAAHGVLLGQAILDSSPVRLMTHLDRFARAGVDPAALLVAIADAELRAGRDPLRATWSPDRRLIAALRDLTPNDTLAAAIG